MAHKIEVLRGHCERESREFADIEISVGVGGRGRDGGAAQPPQIEGAPLFDLGARLFTIGIGGPRYDVASVEPWLAWREEVNGG